MDNIFANTKCLFYNCPKKNSCMLRIVVYIYCCFVRSVCKNMSRCRGFKSLDECVNPIYYNTWGCSVTVKQCIANCFYTLEQKAYRRISQHGYVNLILPDFTTSRVTLEYIHQLCTQLVATEKNIQIIIDTEKWNKHDIVVNFVPFCLQRRANCIPVSWQDNEKDYSWQQVIDNPQYYSSSSTDVNVWPPLEYQIKAHQEKINKIQQNIAAHNGLLN